MRTAGLDAAATVEAVGDMLGTRLHAPAGRAPR
jgi:hypothetical protein